MPRQLCCGVRRRSLTLLVGTVAAISADMNRKVLDSNNKALDKNKTIADITLIPQLNRFVLAEDDTSSPDLVDGGGVCQGSKPKCGQGEILKCALGLNIWGCFPDSGNPDPVEYVLVTLYETHAEIGFIVNGFNPGDQITVHGGLSGSNVEQFTMTKSVPDEMDFLIDGLTPYTKYWFKISSNQGEHKSGSFMTLCKIGVECNGPDSICKVFPGMGDSSGSIKSYITNESEDRSCYLCGGLNDYCCAECADRQACDNPYTCQMDKCLKQSDDKLSFSLPESIYLAPCEDPSLDMDLDGLKDNFENALADAWRPYFIYDENENDQDANIDDISLQSWEPRVLFQVRPTGGWDWPRRIVIKWAFLYRLDGGFRASNFCTDWHYGDTESGSCNLVSEDGVGVTWRLESLDLWKEGITSANDPRIEWTAPRSTYFGEMNSRPSPIVHASAGKHHQYMTAANCEGNDAFCDDDCDGGEHRSADLVSSGSFNNVGESDPNNHPSPPFVTDLGPLGYPGEHVWYSAYKCKCGGMSANAQPWACFTGGLGANWDAGNWPKDCTVPSPVYALFSHEPLTPNPG